jgi:hypothetical protein
MPYYFGRLEIRQFKLPLKPLLTLSGKMLSAWKQRKNIYTGIYESVGIATGYGLDDRGLGVRVPVFSRIFSSPGHPDRILAYLASYTLGTGYSSSGGKAAGA